VLQIDVDRSECDHRKGRNEIVDKDILEGLLGRSELEHLDLCVYLKQNKKRRDPREKKSPYVSSMFERSFVY
jgi:hypothetical protein